MFIHWRTKVSAETKLFEHGRKLDTPSYSHMNIRMSTKGKRPLRSLTPTDKIHAIQRIHDGESKASVARDIGVPESTLRGWCKNEDKLRFMSRQTDKMTADSLADKLGASTTIMGGPLEKRQKLESGSVPFNYSNQTKYDEMVYKRNSLDGIEFSSNKNLSEVGFGAMQSDYLPYCDAAKNKIFSADISRQTDPSLAAISPLSGLSHLTGLPQSPLAISFNELSSNLNLLSQINPSLAAMSGLNGLAATVNTLRSVSTKNHPLLQSPRSDCNDRQQLSVKNWAKQKPTSPAPSAFNLCQNEDNKNKIKCPSPSIAPSLGNSLSPLSILPDDSLLYWLKSQQSMLGMNSIYPSSSAPSMEVSSPSLATSSQRLENLHINSSLNATPLQSSSTPALGSGEKNAAWLYWCKAIGASLNSLVPAAAAVLHGVPLKAQKPTPSNRATTVNIETSISTTSITTEKDQMENILLTQLTKNVECPLTQNLNTYNNIQCKTPENLSLNRPEDLSARRVKTDLEPTLSVPSPLNLETSPSPNTEDSLVPSPVPSPKESCIASNSPLYVDGKENEKEADCKTVLDNFLYKINNNPFVTSLSKATSLTSFDGIDEDSESFSSYTSDKHRNASSDNISSERANKSDEEKHIKIVELNSNERDSEAIKYGEKFLKWLENCSNPRITTTHLMQLRFLLSALKPNANAEDQSYIDNVGKSNPVSCTEYLVDVENSNHLNKGRRRK